MCEDHQLASVFCSCDCYPASCRCLPLIYHSSLFTLHFEEIAYVLLSEYLSVLCDLLLALEYRKFLAVRRQSRVSPTKLQLVVSLVNVKR